MATDEQGDSQSRRHAIDPGGPISGALAVGSRRRRNRRVAVL
jgi:hypothetical protein